MKDIYQFLKEQNIIYDKYEHPAVFTTKEADLICKDIPGKQAKNLFLTNDKGSKHFLVTIAHNKRVDLKRLSEFLGQKSLRFASAERLLKYLGLTPGSVSPLGLINDSKKEVEFVLDTELASQDKIYIHPNINTATLGIKIKDFKNFLNNLDHTIKLLQI